MLLSAVTAVFCVTLCSWCVVAQTVSYHQKQNDIIRSIQEDTTKEPNLARGQSTWQSSTLVSNGHPASSGLAVDGNRDSNFWHQSCAHTLADTNPWWAVDLGRPTNVRKVVVYNRQDVSTENLARGRPTWQSSTYALSSFMPTSDLAVDGNRASNYFHKSCTHSVLPEVNPWWAVDLGRPTNVGKVVFYNRQDCCAYKANGFIVGLTNESPAVQRPTVGKYALCGQHAGSAGAVETVTCFEESPAARYVIVQLNRIDTLTICELEIYERGEWLRNIVVGLTNVPVNTHSPSPGNYAVCGQHRGAVGTVGVVNCAPDSPPARYLIIQVERDRAALLILCEVEVFGRECPEDFVYIRKVNGCYRPVLENIHPALVELRCRTLHKDAHLLIVNNAQEQDAVANMMHIRTGSTMNTCWQYPGIGIGWMTAGRRIDQSPFVWKVTAADNCGYMLHEMHYSKWQPGEPSSPTEDCLYMFSALNYKWGDHHCLPACVICELDM